MKKTETNFKPLILESKVLDVKRLEREVVHWASQRDLYKNSSATDQLRYLKDEIDEALEAIEMGTLEEQAVELGDIIVFAINAMHILKLNLATCLFLAVHKIKDRTGKIINGKFVKQEDLDEEDRAWNLLGGGDDQL